MQTQKTNIENAEGFDWHIGTLAKNMKHGVSLAETEELFLNPPYFVSPDEKHSIGEFRFTCYGKTTKNRNLVIVFTMRGKRIRVISARDMNKREKKYYEEQIKKAASI